jgi:hypothetical protein
MNNTRYRNCQSLERVSLGSLFSGPFLSGLEFVNVLNLAGAVSRFRRERPRRSSQRFERKERRVDSETTPTLSRFRENAS